MCGVLGFAGKLDNERAYRFITDGLSSLESRGKDATGIYSSELKLVLKAPERAKNFLESTQTKKFIKRVVTNQKNGCVLCHSRNWTQGKPDSNDNNHPIWGKEIVLVHNGMVDGDKVKSYEYKGETDSEILLSHIESSKEKTEVKRIKDGIEKVSGQVVIAVEFKDTGNLYLYRHNNPLYVGKYKNTILFTSTDDIFSEAVANFPGNLFKGIELVELPENEIYFVQNSDVLKTEEAKPKVAVTKPYTGNYWDDRYSYGYGYGGYGSYFDSAWGNYKDYGKEEYPLHCAGCAFNWTSKCSLLEKPFKSFSKKEKDKDKCDLRFPKFLTTAKWNSSQEKKDLPKKYVGIIDKIIKITENLVEDDNGLFRTFQFKFNGVQYRISVLINSKKYSHDFLFTIHIGDLISSQRSFFSVNSSCFEWIYKAMYGNYYADDKNFKFQTPKEKGVALAK